MRLERASGLIAADSNGLSDPFAEVSVGWNKVTSSVVERSLDPKWNEDLELRGTFGELSSSLKIALFDKDPIKWNDGLGEVVVDLEALRNRSSLKFSKQPLSTQGSVSFTVSWSTLGFRSGHGVLNLLDSMQGAQRERPSSYRLPPTSIVDPPSGALSA